MPNFPAHSASDEKGRWSPGTKILLGIIVLVVVILAAGVITLNITTMDAEPGAVYPYVTSYQVTLPEGEPVSIGTSRIVVLSYGDEMVADVNGNREKLVVGEERTIGARNARITTLGMPLIDANFQIALRYMGANGKNANFAMTVKTSKQVPELVLRRLLPPNMNAQPV